MRAVTLENVVNAVIQATIAKCWSGRAAFTGVVINNIQDHFNVGAMQRFHHVSKLIVSAKNILARTVGMVRRKEGDRRVSPIVDQTGRTIHCIEFKHRQQFNRCDPEFFKIRDLFDDTSVGAALLLRDSGIWVVRESTYMHLVDDRLRDRPLSGTSPSQS